MINIENLLINNKNIDGYKINRTKTTSYELFFVHNDLETVRATDTEAVVVTVYRDHDGKKGHASFKLYASTTEEEAECKIDDAAQKALLISNEYYTLPENSVSDGAIESNFADIEPKEAAAKIADAVFSANTLENCSINALEIFINKITNQVKNSCGVDKREIKYSAIIEAIPTWNEGESVELYEAIRVSNLDVSAISAEIAAKMCEVRDRGYAKAPESRVSCLIKLNAPELGELFENFAYGLDYSSVYSHSNPFSEGDLIQKAPEGDKIGLTMKGQIKGCTASALFDSDGTDLTDTKIIDGGKVCSYFGNHRFAQYLNKPTTGSLSCIELDAGSITKEALNSAPYFECVSMSGLQVDIFNDYIGGEVRLAYYFDGEKKIPLTGISISGKLSEALNTVRFSSNTKQHGRYYGPEFALFGCIEIV